MSLTSSEETTLKAIVVKENKQAQIDTINKSAYTAINVKRDEIQVLEDKRIADIKALD